MDINVAAPAFTLEKCKYCGKRRILLEGFFKSEWKCSFCGKKNEKELPDPWLM